MSDLFGKPVCDKFDRDSPPTSDPAAVPEALDFCKDDSLSEEHSGVATQSVRNNLIGSAEDRLLHEPGVSLVSDNTNIQNNPSASQMSDLFGKPVCDIFDRDPPPITAALIRNLLVSLRATDKVWGGGFGWASDDLRAYIWPPDRGRRLVTRGA
jgi:hypothetical protein